jgi:hypothetical protein
MALVDNRQRLDEASETTRPLAPLSLRRGSQLSLAMVILTLLYRPYKQGLVMSSASVLSAEVKTSSFDCTPAKSPAVPDCISDRILDGARLQVFTGIFRTSSHRSHASHGRAHCSMRTGLRKPRASTTYRSALVKADCRPCSGRRAARFPYLLCYCLVPCTGIGSNENGCTIAPMLLLAPSTSKIFDTRHHRRNNSVLEV